MKPSILRRQVARRRAQRGAAMVEAAFMFPMFIILFFSVIYAHSFSATKIDEATQARELAWTNAMGNCGKTGDAIIEKIPDQVSDLSVTRGNFTGVEQTSQIAIQTTTSPQSPMNGESSSTKSGVSEAIAGGSIEGAFGNIANMLVGVVADLFPDPDGAQGVGTGTVSWRLPNNSAASDPTNSTKLTQTVTVMCDETVQNGSVLTVVKDLIGDIGGFVSGAL